MPEPNDIDLVLVISAKHDFEEDLQPGIPRTLFLTKLADYGVETFKLTEKELQQEHRLA